MKKQKFSKEEEQLWKYIEKHFRKWERLRFRAVIKNLFRK